MKLFILSTPYIEYCIAPMFYKIGFDLIVLKEHHNENEFDFPVQLEENIEKAVNLADYVIFVNSSELSQLVVPKIINCVPENKLFIIEEENTHYTYIENKVNLPRVIVIETSDSSESLKTELQIMYYFHSQGINVTGNMSNNCKKVFSICNSISFCDRFNNTSNLEIILNSFKLTSTPSYNENISNLSMFSDFVILCVEDDSDYYHLVDILKYKYGVTVDVILVSNHITYIHEEVVYKIFKEVNRNIELDTLHHESKTTIYPNTLESNEKIIKKIIKKISIPDEVKII